MSHFTNIKTKLYDQATIEKSLSDLNIEWQAGLTTVRGYNNQHQAAEIVIPQKNNHDIDIFYDFFQSFSQRISSSPNALRDYLNTWTEVGL